MEKKPGDKADDDGMTTRLEACKTELIRALGLLDPKTKFNVIWYSELPYQFKPGMLFAKSGSIKAAQDWVRKLQPSGSTNIHDSMHMGFQLTGQIPGLGGAQKGPITGNKKLREAAPDTIFLLSDGSPTLPTGGADSTEKIIAAVRKWNSLKTVVVHCIGIGRGVNTRFMRQLATENGGEFKKF
jgi:Mg-chelatase subunit ChlD